MRATFLVGHLSGAFDLIAAIAWEERIKKIYFYGSRISFSSIRLPI
jgi:hypothetical protein